MELLAAKIHREIFDNLDSTADIIKNKIPNFDEFICNSIKKNGVVRCEFEITSEIEIKSNGYMEVAKLPMVYYTYILNYLHNQGFMVEEKKYENGNTFGYERLIIAFL